MKTRLENLIAALVELKDRAEDDEFIDEIDNALIHLEAASDRLVAIDEEEDEAEPDDGDQLYDQWKDNQLTDV